MKDDDDEEGVEFVRYSQRQADDDGVDHDTCSAAGQ